MMAEMMAKLLAHRDGLTFKGEHTVLPEKPGNSCERVKLTYVYMYVHTTTVLIVISHQITELP